LQVLFECSSRLFLWLPQQLQAGLELLQHAVCWGMVALAGRLLTELMAEPLSLPFDALARGQLPHTHTYTSSSAQQQEQQQSFSVGAERAADSTALMQTAIHAAAPRTLSHPSSGISSMGAKKSADSTTTAAVATSSQRSLCSPSLQDAHPPVTWKFVLRALVLGFDSQGDVNETDYRSVCGKQQASVWQAAGQCVAGNRSVCGRLQVCVCVCVWQTIGQCVISDERAEVPYLMHAQYVCAI
jgi:hypothetical protein